MFPGDTHSKSDFTAAMFGQDTIDDDPYALNDGSKIAVVGGGPTGSFFSIFASQMAGKLDRKLDITIYDPKDFNKTGPSGCNRCAGMISELLVQTLAVEGINLPESVVWKGINSYQLHTTRGTVSIATPSLEKTIAAVYRGSGPKGIVNKEKESFDRFLLEMAQNEGAVHEPVKIDRVRYRDGKPVLMSRNREIEQVDLVVGAVGVNGMKSRIFEDMGFGYREPRTVKAAIGEMRLSEEIILEHFGNCIHIFLLPIRNIKFAAMVPKGSYVTLCALGQDMDANTLTDFLKHPVVRAFLPDRVSHELHCRCLPKMNIKAPKIPFNDRVVMCGDAGSTRLFKDGLGASYIMGKAAAVTAVLHGVRKSDFQKNYYPIYRSLIVDNRFGRSLYSVIELYKRYGLLTSGMLAVVQEEQDNPKDPKRFSSILWNMFTGNERFRNIFHINNFYY